MKQWGINSKKKAEIKIKPKGIEKALMAGKEDFEQREFDRDVIAFMHIISSILYNDKLPKENAKFPIERLFEIIDSRTYRRMMKLAKTQLGTDDVPTDFARDLYSRFLEWQSNPNRMSKPSSQKNYGQRCMNNRWELGEFPREGWMSADTEKGTR